MRVQFLYFGIIRDLTGKNEEELAVNSKTVREALEELYQKYNKLKDLSNSFRVAVDGKIANYDDIIKENSVIALLPPVSGGTTK